MIWFNYLNAEFFVSLYKISLFFVKSFQSQLEETLY